MEKKELTPAATKAEFIKSIYNWLMKTLEDNDFAEYKPCFKIEGSSIMCNLPEKYFNLYTIPTGTKIEMKFITKKS